MDFFDELVGKLFPKKSSPSNPLVHELLVRSEEDLALYDLWDKSDEMEELLDDVVRAYFLKKQGILSQAEVHLLNSEYSNGFAVRYLEEYGERNFRHFFDFLKEQVLRMEYKLEQNDRRIIDRGDYELIIEKWYLKSARYQNEEGLIDQKYGNVLIEHHTVDRHPSFIKLQANIYQDRLYTKPLAFDEFINKLLQID